MQCLFFNVISGNFGPMSVVEILFLVLLGFVFFIWAILWFRVLFRLKRVSFQRKEAAKVGYFGWVLINFGVFRDFFIRPEFHGDRRKVLISTAVLFAIILIRLVILTSG